MSETDTNASQILLEISRGYSVLNHGPKVFYFKHPTNQHNLVTEEYYYARLQKAKKQGILSEDKLIQRYIKRGVWSVKKEDKLKSLKWTINKSIVASQKITDNMQRKFFEQSIEAERKELADLQQERDKLTGQSAENWASQQRMFKIVHDHLFIDKEMKRQVDFNEDIALFILMQDKIVELSSKKNLAAAAFDNSFFDIYSLQYRDPMKIFNVNFYSITIFQRYLLSYASSILNKLKNVEMPDDVKNDPVKILDFNPDDKSSVSKVSHGIDDIKNKIKNKGKLTPEDLIN
jgi:hypothetical protein